MDEKPKAMADFCRQEYVSRFLIHPFLSFHLIILPIMKKFLSALILLLAIANIWIACSKDSTPTPTSAKEAVNTETTVSDRSSATVTISNAYNFQVCGNLENGSCSGCYGSYYPYIIDQTSSTLTMLDGSFCLQNRTSSAQTVTIQVSGCSTPYSFSIPAEARRCYRISGCTVLANCL